MSLALRKRCHNMLLESKWKLKYLNKQYRNKLCEINFFPLVHTVGEVPTQKGQKLECREDVEGMFPLIGLFINFKFLMHINKIKKTYTMNRNIAII